MSAGARLQRRTERNCVPMIKQQPPLVDRLALWLSTSRRVDGLWVGSMESDPQPGLGRVEEAIHLIKRHDLLHYSRVIHNLERIWVHILPDAAACYQRSLKACVFDERFVLSETTTLERIATTIIHEATHAKLEHCGIRYEETQRPRIEAICLQREIAFASKLADNDGLRDELVRTMEWCTANPEYFSSMRFRERYYRGQIKTFHYLGMPRWLIQALLALQPVFLAVRRLLRWTTRRRSPPRIIGPVVTPGMQGFDHVIRNGGSNEHE